MTALYGSTQSGIAEHTAKQPKVFLMAGGLFLHQSGLCLQKGRQYAWSGTIEQARAMRRTSDAAAGCKAIHTPSITPTLQPVEDDA